MAGRFHVNPATGDYGPCHAVQGKCPFGGGSGDDNHYKTMSEAKSASEEWHKRHAVKPEGMSRKTDGRHTDLTGFELVGADPVNHGLPEGSLKPIDDDMRSSIDSLMEEYTRPCPDKAELQERLDDGYAKGIERLKSARDEAHEEYKARSEDYTRAWNAARRARAKAMEAEARGLADRYDKALADFDNADGIEAKMEVLKESGVPIVISDVLRDGGYKNAVLRNNPEDTQSYGTLKSYKPTRFRGVDRMRMSFDVHRVLTGRDFIEGMDGDYTASFPLDVVDVNGARESLVQARDYTRDVDYVKRAEENKRFDQTMEDVMVSVRSNIGATDEDKESDKAKRAMDEAYGRYQRLDAEVENVEKRYDTLTEAIRDGYATTWDADVWKSFREADARGGQEQADEEFHRRLKEEKGFGNSTALESHVLGKDDNGDYVVMSHTDTWYMYSDDYGVPEDKVSLRVLHKDTGTLKVGTPFVPMGTGKQSELMKDSEFAGVSFVDYNKEVESGQYNHDLAVRMLKDRVSGLVAGRKRLERSVDDFVRSL